MEEDIKRNVGGKSLIKKIGFYAILFLAGFLLSAFAREGLDAIKKTASLAATTAGEAWSPSSGQKVIAKIPLDNSAEQTKTVASAKNSKLTAGKKPALTPEIKKTYADTPLPPPPVVSQEATSSATSSIQAKQEPAAPKETIETSPSPTSTPAAPPNQTPSVIQDNPTPPSMAATSTGKILFYEIQISGASGETGATYQDFIRIYNPNSFDVDISEWKLKKKTSTGTEGSIPPATIPKGTSIAPGGTLIWANNKNNFAATIGAQFPSASMTISKNNSVALFDSVGNIIDAVAWGDGASQFVEGLPYPTNPEGGQILRRKKDGQVLKDTDNNAADFSV